MKRVLSLCIAFLMLLGLMPMAAFTVGDDGSPLDGLNVLCLGDSITAGQGLTTDTRWSNVLASKYDWNLTNKSQGGISLSSYYYTANGNSDVSIAKNAEILKTMTTKPDVIIVWGGHNDTSYRYSPLGTWDDDTTDSFKGALKYIAELADEYAPDATLFVLTPLWTTEAPSTLKVPENTTDNNWMFVDAIYEGADKYGWIPINMDLCGINPFTKSSLLLDNIHPNAAGTEKIVAYLSEELASYGANSSKETIIFNESAVSMNPGESAAVKGVLSPRSGTGVTEFNWSSSDSLVATVDANGQITAVAHGSATVTATAANGTSADIAVSVGCEHSYGQWVQVSAPTCKAEGQDKRTCADCGDVQYRDTRISGDPNKIQVSNPVDPDYYVGKKIVFLGDSVTYGSFIDTVSTDAYPYVLGDSLGATVSNRATSGSSLCTGGHVTANSKLTEANIKGADVVTILLGVNDFNHAVKDGIYQGTLQYDPSASYYDLGDYNSTDTSEYYGALRAWCEKIVEFKAMPEFENTEFIFITMPITARNRSVTKNDTWDQTKTNIFGHTLRAYCTAIMEICAEYNIPVFDANMYSGIYYNSPDDNNAELVGGSDGIHPTAAGHALIAKSLEEFLLEGYSYESRTVVNCGHSNVNGACEDCHLPDSHTHTYENGICTGCGAEDPNPYAGKTIVCIGDSITAGVGVTKDETDYVTLLAQSLEMEYVRLGASGTTLCTDGPRTCNIGKVTEQNLSGADVVTILMGINDFCAAKDGSYALGTIDSTDTSTIYGAVHMWCQRIKELRQTEALADTQFYFLTPVITSWNSSVTSARNWDQSKTNIHGYTLRDLCNAIIEVCALYDIPVIDLNLISGLYYVSEQDNNIDVFGGDGVHPGADGHAMMASAIADALLRNDLRDDHEHSYGSWITTTYPDCESGEEKQVCQICCATESRKLAGKGHTYSDGICTGCGEAEPHSHSYESTVTIPTCTEQGYTTYTCECGDSYAADFVDARGYEWMLEDGEFKILLIGNSFSEDASNAGMPHSQMLDILQAMLGEHVKVTVGLCYSGGKGLNWHATQSEQGNKSYSLRVISTDSGKWTSYGSYTSASALTWTDWDVVSLQHYEIDTSTGKESNAYSDQVDPKFDNLESATEFMLDYVDEYAPNAAVYFYMHWARAYKSNINESLATYNNMAEFFPVVMDYVGPNSANRFEAIIPVGLAVQNARTTYLATLAYNTTAYADKNLNLNTDAQIGLQRDGGHLSYNIGRYLAALTFAETIIPDQLRADGYVLPEIRVTESIGKLPKEYTIIVQKAVHAAVESWKNGSLAVTNIEGYSEDPTVAATKLLESMNLNLSCGYVMSLEQQIRDTVLAVLPIDFVVDQVIVDTEASTASVTIRFGYTSKTVEMVYTECEIVLGDLDLDGDVDAQDLTMLARHVAGIESVTGQALLNADVDGDGDVDANDLTMHARYVAGIISSWDQT